MKKKKSDLMSEEVESRGSDLKARRKSFGRKGASQKGSNTSIARVGCWSFLRLKSRDFSRTQKGFPERNRFWSSSSAVAKQ